MKYFPTSVDFYIQNFRPNQTKTFDLPILKRGNIKVVIEESIIKIPPRPDRDNPGGSSGVHPATGMTAQVINGTTIIAEGDDNFSKMNHIQGGGFQLKIKNNAKRRKYIRITVNYVSNRQILEKKIPIAFFQQTFDAFWNKVQPLEQITFKNKKLSIKWTPAFNEIFDLDYVKDFSDILPDRLILEKIESDKITLTAETKLVGNKLYPCFTTHLTIKDDIVIKVKVGTTFEVAKLTGFSIKIAICFDMNGAFVLPKVYGQTDVLVLPDGYVDDLIDTTIESILKENIEKYTKDYIPKFQKWFLGGDFDVYSFKVKDNIIVIEYAENTASGIGADNEVGYPGDIPGNTTSSATTSSGLGPANIRPMGKLKEIDHIVVLMMENRSFDQMLGYLSLQDDGMPHSKVNGLKESEYDNWANEYNGEKYKPYNLKKEEVKIETSPNHGYEDVKDQKAYNMKGFVRDFASRSDLKDDPRVVMGYYNGEQLKVYKHLADNFLVCDRWYCSFPGGTWPNRFITLSGQLQKKADGFGNYDNPSLSEFYPIHDKTLFDILSEKNVSWKYFEHGYCFLRLYAKYTYDMENIVGANSKKGFFNLAREGKLPSVSFIDPDFIEYPPGNDDHAPAHPYCGQKLIGNIVNALMSNKKAWEKTMLIITYDEHGGFFDHVNPTIDEPAPTIDGKMNEYGVRVPAIIVSPWVKKGGFTNRLLDHTSIAATILRRFCSPRIPDMGPRTNNAHDLEHIIEDKIRKNIPKVTIPTDKEYNEACKPENLRTPVSATKSNNAKEDEFHELLLMASMFGRSPK